MIKLLYSIKYKNMINNSCFNLCYQEKPHKCDVCGKSFPTPGDLKSHGYVHSGSWPYRCSVCRRGFSKQTNLKNHLFLHTGKHNEERSYLYSCVDVQSTLYMGGPNISHIKLSIDKTWFLFLHTPVVHIYFFRTIMQDHI
jgi:uncharacterized Zn-finger protein